ncbi:MAG: hypothetical protein GFH27_549313n140 [Chloroflexi bacterium AL-W]|nr:hypothetical protein [Chloroflexi bacterium AL-N1]NOK69563.1 hypothetical protein [Chloroflexi bacterium AL-N10]NOK77528.1 hypothetical protein [Chloroflexi bacterium AL-N5]NOK84379.1 hypothetical protein [Chloroflexi bacterium AL-W]NOK91455.1 hypothetical protein [Chloroflexi bacterium AL-N15]
MIVYLVRSLSSTALFASCPFLTAFLITVAARIGYETSVNPAFSSSVMGNEATMALSLLNFTAWTWVISNTALTIFAVLALIEFIAHINEDTRIMYAEVSYIFPFGGSLTINFGLVDSASAEFLQVIIASIPAEAWFVALPLVGGQVGLASTSGGMIPTFINSDILAWMGHVLALMWSLIMAGVAWFIGTLRSGILGLLIEFDDDDSLGIQSILNWAENAWVVIGIVVLVIFPIIALVLFFLTLVSLFLIRKWFEHREHHSLVPCPSCETLIHPTALTCPNCSQPYPQPRRVGLFGQAKDTLVTDRAAHRLQLIGRKRCPVCATRFKERAIQQTCASCDTVTFADISGVNVYLRSLDAQLPRTLAICLGLGCIPLIGLVPGIVYYRLSLVASLRGYIPRSVGCITR